MTIAIIIATVIVLTIIANRFDRLERRIHNLENQPRPTNPPFSATSEDGITFTLTHPDPESPMREGWHDD